MSKFRKNLVVVLFIIAIVSLIFVISDFIIKTTMTGFYAAAVFAVSAGLAIGIGLYDVETENPSNNDLIDDGIITFH